VKNENLIASVLMPVYNGAAFLRPAIESVLNQGFRDLELILLNDGSTDASEEIILSFKDERIRYVKNEKNLGLIETLNKGIDLAQGKYIIRMDADDICMPGRFEKQVRFMESNPDIGAAGTGYLAIIGNSIKKINVLTEPEVLRGMLLFNSCLCHPSVIIRKNVLLQNNIRYNPDYKHVEDYELWTQVSKVSKLGNQDEFLLKYRSHQGQISQVHSSIQKDNAARIRRNYLQSLGFTFTDDEFATHNLVANNQFIHSHAELNKIEKWFLDLIEQNKKQKAIHHEHFSFLLGKMWYDSCGITTLGLSAYKRYFRSPLASSYPLSFKQRSKLAVKCLIRKFKGK